MKTQWIDYSGDEVTGIGGMGFVVEVSNPYRGTSTVRLESEPPRTNQSHEPVLNGWCGETNNVSRYGCGAAKIVKLNKAGTRALVRQLTCTELAIFLASSGYPDLD